MFLSIMDGVLSGTSTICRKEISVYLSSSLVEEILARNYLYKLSGDKHHRRQIGKASITTLPNTEPPQVTIISPRLFNPLDISTRSCKAVCRLEKALKDTSAGTACLTGSVVL